MIDDSLLRIRKELMEHIISFINRYQLTQSEVAKQLKITQPRVSNLMTKKAQLFTVDTLIEMLIRLGFRVNMTCSKSSAQRKRTASK